MNKKEISLYLDGLSDDSKSLILQHLEAINRLSRYEDGGACLWQITDNAQRADLFLLGNKQRFENPQKLARPILFDGVVPSDLKPVAVQLKFPITSMALDKLMRETISNFKPVAVSEKVKIPVGQPEKKKTAHKNANSVKTTISTTESVLKPQKMADEVKPSSNFAATRLKPFFEDYLEKFSKEKQAHIFTYPDSRRVYFHRLDDKVFSDYDSIRDLVRMLSQDTWYPKVKNWQKAPTHLHTFSAKAVLWSYGLHAPLSKAIQQKYNVAEQKIRLKDLPLFGHWESDNSLISLAKLFSEKACSVQEAADKSNTSKAFVLHFIAAVELVGLSFEIQRLPHEKANTATATPQKKKKSWLSGLYKKRRK